MPVTLWSDVACPWATVFVARWQAACERAGVRLQRYRRERAVIGVGPPRQRCSAPTARAGEGGYPIVDSDDESAVDELVARATASP